MNVQPTNCQQTENICPYRTPMLSKTPSPCPQLSQTVRVPDAVGDPVSASVGTQRGKDAVQVQVLFQVLRLLFLTHLPHEIKIWFESISNTLFADKNCYRFVRKPMNNWNFAAIDVYGGCRRIFFWHELYFRQRYAFESGGASCISPNNIFTLIFFSTRVLSKCMK